MWETIAGVLAIACLVICLVSGLGAYSARTHEALFFSRVNSMTGRPIDDAMTAFLNWYPGYQIATVPYNTEVETDIALYSRNGLLVGGEVYLYPSLWS